MKKIGSFAVTAAQNSGESALHAVSVMLFGTIFAAAVGKN
tara:strand:+ start:334 stop:453 length:120 start_codon:yes stop_codon:yes gene_type:complete